METVNQVPTAPGNFYLYKLACLGTAALIAVGAAYSLLAHQNLETLFRNAKIGGMLGLVSLMLPAAEIDLGLFGRKELTSKVGE